MFGISIWQILLTVLIGLILWRGPAMLARLKDGVAKAMDEHQTGGSRQAGNGGPRRPASEGGGGRQAIDLQPCPRCGAYVDPREGCRCRQT